MPKVTGFTLVELLVTLTIIGILSALIAPSFASIVADNKQAIQHNRLVTAISLIRSEAIKRGQRVTLCQSADLISCTKDSTGWHHGWVVYVDSDQDNKIDPTESILWVQNSIPDMTVSFGHRTRVAYRSSGLAVGGSNGTFLLCDHRGDVNKKGVIISNSGRVRLAKKADLALKFCPVN